MEEWRVEIEEGDEEREPHAGAPWTVEKLNHGAAEAARGLSAHDDRPVLAVFDVHENVTGELGDLVVREEPDEPEHRECYQHKIADRDLGRNEAPPVPPAELQGHEKEKDGEEDTEDEIPEVLVVPDERTIEMSHRGSVAKKKPLGKPGG